MSKSKRHHIVPQCYLKAFVNCNGNLHTLPKDDRRAFEANPSKVAVRKNYYSFENGDGEIDARIEAALADLEGHTKPILNDIYAQKPISDGQKFDLSLFVGLMFSRNPNFRDGIEEYMRQMVDVFKDRCVDFGVLNEQIENAPDAIVELAGGKENVGEWMKSNLEIIVSPEASLHYVHLGIRYAQLINNMHWRLWVNENSRIPLLTSDNPCYVCNKAMEKSFYGVGMALQGSSLHLPLSPKICLIADWEGSHTEYVAIRDKRKSTRINSRTIRHAENEVYSPMISPEVEKLFEKNKMYGFETLIDHVGPYHLFRKKLKKKR